MTKLLVLTNIQQQPNMPTKLEQATAVIANMTPLELDCLKGIFDKHGELARVKQLQNTKCRLLDLPAEMRNLIWIFAGIIHLRNYGNTQRCGLLSVNKQVRIEFMDVLYSDKVVVQLKSGRIDKGDYMMAINFKHCVGKTTLKALLDGGEKVARIMGEQFATGSNTKAEIAKQVKAWRTGGSRNKAMELGLLVLSSGDRANSVTFRCGSHREGHGSKYIVTEHDSDEREQYV